MFAADHALYLQISYGSRVMLFQNKLAMLLLSLFFFHEHEKCARVPEMWETAGAGMV